MSEVPQFVKDNIYTLPQECKHRGITRRKLADLAHVDYDTVKGYARLERRPTRIMYNRIAGVFGWRQWP